MWTKICANTNIEDAVLAATRGADALGFVFAESKRRVTAEQVAAMVPLLPARVERIGVFTAHKVAEIAEVVQIASLTSVQLHDGFDAERTRMLQEQLPHGIGVIETVHWGIGLGADEANRVRRIMEKILRDHGAEEELPRVLVDAKMGAASGGLGVSFEWNDARELFQEFAGRLHLILAGGLRPENVRVAARELQPWGVDVASGVEAQPGRKDHIKLAEFLRMARMDEAEISVSPR